MDAQKMVQTFFQLEAGVILKVCESLEYTENSIRNILAKSAPVSMEEDDDDILPRERRRVGGRHRISQG